MRPIHLEIEGFGPFRQKTEIDLSDIELVALVGRTGSGKSTVIDAMTFALFGGISRYGKNKLFPAINQMSNEALVALTFLVGERTYKVVRKLVRTSNNGASTKEARLGLDDGSEIVGVDDIDQEITRLLGLDFDQFNKAVFLPQGKFAEFLHESPTKRQKILRSILDLGVYEKVRILSNKRVAEAETEIRILESRLQEISHITEDVVEDLTARSKGLRKLGSSVKIQIDSIRDQLANLQALNLQHKTYESQLIALDSVEKPKDLDSLENLRSSAKMELSRLQQEYDERNKDLRQIEKTMESLTTPGQLIPIIQNFKRLTQVQTSLAEKSNNSSQLQKQLALAEEEHLLADQATNKAALAYDTLLSKSRVSAFVKDLVIGKPCPLCLSEVKSIPQHNHDLALHDAQKRKDESKSVADQAFHKKTSIKSELDASAQVIHSLSYEEKTLQNNLDVATSLRESEQKLKLYEKTQAKRDSLSKEVQQLQHKVKEARITLEGFQQREAAQRSIFDESRDMLSRAGLNPPGASTDAMVANWNELLRWREENKILLVAKKHENEISVQKVTTAVEEQKTALLSLLKDEDIPYQGPFDEESLPLMVERAHSKVKHELASAKKALKRKMESLQKFEATNKQLNIYNMLSKNLESRRFEAWLLQEVLEELAEGATKHLFTLSSGAYSLELSRKDFVVRDHHNADEIRVAESLSGGETFLASLSLALALSDSIAGMAPEGAAKLESLFLDEGFGTLDSDTLDVVASSIEDLGSEGRMIGIVTHVEEIAQRMPVRIKVTKGSESSFVERQES